eukprot:scaffold128_cov248-Pinguiococcus_pyrenoidosus.AAC.28
MGAAPGWIWVHRRRRDGRASHWESQEKAISSSASASILGQPDSSLASTPAVRLLRLRGPHPETFHGAHAHAHAHLLASLPSTHLSHERSRPLFPSCGCTSGRSFQLCGCRIVCEGASLSHPWSPSSPSTIIIFTDVVSDLVSSLSLSSSPSDDSAAANSRSSDWGEVPLLAEFDLLADCSGTEHLERRRPPAHGVAPDVVEALVARAAGEDEHVILHDLHAMEISRVHLRLGDSSGAVPARGLLPGT